MSSRFAMTRTPPQPNPEVPTMRTELLLGIVVTFLRYPMKCRLTPFVHGFFVLTFVFSVRGHVLADGGESAIAPTSQQSAMPAGLNFGLGLLPLLTEAKTRSI
jgi:hypothetical protein